MNNYSIGILCGYSDHSNIYHAVKTIGNYVETDHHFKAEFDRIDKTAYKIFEQQKSNIDTNGENDLSLIEQLTLRVEKLESKIRAMNLLKYENLCINDCKDFSCHSFKGRRFDTV